MTFLSGDLRVQDWYQVNTSCAELGTRKNGTLYIEAYEQSAFEGQRSLTSKTEMANFTVLGKCSDTFDEQTQSQIKIRGVYRFVKQIVEKTGRITLDGKPIDQIVFQGKEMKLDGCWCRWCKPNEKKPSEFCKLSSIQERFWDLNLYVAEEEKTKKPHLVVLLPESSGGFHVRSFCSDK